MKRIVIYHGGGCADGFCAAWLFHQIAPDAEYIAANYGDEPPDVTGATVAILDFSYPRDVMLRLCEQAHHLLLLDHHKTAYEDLSGFTSQFLKFERPPCIKVTLGKSGGRLTWEWLYGVALLPESWLISSKSGYSVGVPPWLVAYTEDRDLWKWELPNSREINAALRSYRQEFSQWDFLHDIGRNSLQPLVVEGRAILRAEQRVIDNHVQNARESEIAGHKVLVVNATSHISEIAGELAKDRPFGVAYFDRADGKRVWSLRSTKDGVDVAAIAKANGGGGHQHAAGYESAL